MDQALVKYKACISQIHP